MMPPKRRLGAAAKAAAAKARAKALAKAKAKAKAGVRRPVRREGGGSRRRPAAAETGGEAPEVGAEKEGRFEAGEIVEAVEVSALAWLPKLEVAFEGSYWQAPGQVAGLVQSLVQVGPRREVHLLVKGTNLERLLKWASGHKSHFLKVHLCERDCPGEEVADDLFHGQKVRLIGEETRLPWMRCLEDAREDELPALRAELDKHRGEKAVDGKGVTSSSSGSRDKEKRRKERRKEVKKKKKEKKEKKARKSCPRDKEDPVAPGARFKGQMKLEGIFGGTGLDPSMEVRRDVRRRVRRSMRSKKKKEGESSGSSSSQRSDSLSVETLFPETQKVRSVVKRAPGALASQAIEEMQEQLITASGQVWSLQTTGAVPPLVLHYYRTVMRQRMTGGIAREALTLAYLIDLALQGRVAESLDVGLQRLKSLELTSSGTDYRISQRMELAPPEMESVASTTERKEALQEAKEELKLKNQSGKGGDWWRSDSWKGSWGEKDGKGKKGKKGEKGSGDRQKGDWKGDDRGKKEDKKK